MKTPAQPPRSLGELRSLTPARVALGRTGASLPTKALLDFTLDHARARDAVHAALDASTIVSGLAGLGLEAIRVRSRAGDRKTYLRRPDLGRTLDEGSQHLLANRGGNPCRLAIVVADGLSPSAVNAHAVEIVRRLIPHLAADGIEIGCAAVATGARVALGDEIGAILGAHLTVVLIGERPGLSASDSLGAYLTFAPHVGRTDAERNCVSNIHGAGLGYGEAAFRIAWLIREALAREVTGVALKDESAGQMPPRISGHSNRCHNFET
jgi:ethanolamine ammonia-lyase small subunit